MSRIERLNRQEHLANVSEQTYTIYHDIWSSHSSDACFHESFVSCPWLWIQTCQEQIIVWSTIVLGKKDGAKTDWLTVSEKVEIQITILENLLDDTSQGIILCNRLNYVLYFQSKQRPRNPWYLYNLNQNWENTLIYWFSETTFSADWLSGTNVFEFVRSSCHLAPWLMRLDNFQTMLVWH